MGLGMEGQPLWFSVHADTQHLICATSAAQQICIIVIIVMEWQHLRMQALFRA
jgi:hypothetical protein